MDARRAPAEGDHDGTQLGERSTVPGLAVGIAVALGSDVSNMTSTPVRSAAAAALLLAPAEARADAIGNPIAWLLVLAALPLGAAAALATWPLVPRALKGSRLRERLRTWSGLAFIFALLFIALFIRCAGM